MRSLEEYMKLPYKMEIIEDPYEGGYVVSFPELIGCLTCGDTIIDAIEMSKEAKELWFKDMIEQGLEIPEPEINNDKYSGQFKIRIPKKLHRSLALEAKKEGVSMNQYCMYLLASNNATHIAKKHYK